MNDIPEDLAGYQLVVCGLIQDGDVLVHGPLRQKSWACHGGSIGYPVNDPGYPDMDVYRKIDVPRHSDATAPAMKFAPGDWLERDQNKAKTDDGGKPPLATLPWKGLRQVALVQAYGHKKYGDFYNYKKGMEATRQLNCTIRHIADWLDGTDLDKESGVNHLAHAATRLLFLLETLEDKTAIDDRYKKL